MHSPSGSDEDKHFLDAYEGNVYRPFAELIALEKIDERAFRSKAPPFTPGGSVGPGRTYGAHVYCQAVWAACQTITKGFFLHHVSGNFILAGQPTVPFVYKVHLVRDGRSYCTRIVNVTQSDGKGISFTCICSFKTAEPVQVEAQDHMDLWKQYDSVLNGKKPEDFPECPGMDVPFYRERRRVTGINDQFPGLECRRVDMTEYNKSRTPLDRRQLIFYRTIGDMADDPNLHICGHLYASDRNSLYAVADAFNLGDRFTQLGSLAHTVVLHNSHGQLLFGAGDGTSAMNNATGQWYCVEAYGSRLGSGRALYHCRLWSAKGDHIATAMQDGMFRFSNSATVSKAEAEELQQLQREWQKPQKL